MTRVRSALIVAAAVAAVTLSAASPEPTAVVDLLNRLPAFPTTAQEAAKWFNRDGTLVHPALVALKADIETHRKLVSAPLEGHDSADRAEAAAKVDDLSKGMAGVGIDMPRMQKDPAYAKEVQERMKTMSPQEIMAMSQKMAQPMNADRRLSNEAVLMANDPPAVQAAAEAARVYGDAQASRLQAHQALWAESDKSVALITAKPIAAPATKPRIEYDNPGCDTSCQQLWQAYADKMLPLLLARDTDVLTSRRSAFDRDRASIIAGVQEAQTHLTATQYGAAAKSRTHQSRIVGYDASAVNEIQMLVTRMEDIVKQAGLRANCGTQSVLVPNAVCR